MIVERQKWFTRYRSSGETMRRMICFPYAGGSDAIYTNWASRIKGDVEVLAVCLPGRARRFTEAPHWSIVELVNDILPSIEGVLDQPYVIFGHSMGSKIGYELLKRILARDLPVPEKFIASACVAPSVSERGKLLWRMSDAEFLKAVVNMNGIPEEVASNSELMNFLAPILKNDFKMSCDYFDQSPSVLEVEAHVIYGAHDHLEQDAVLQWARHFKGRTSDHKIEGDHFYIENRQEEFFETLNLILGLPDREVSVAG